MRANTSTEIAGSHLWLIVVTAASFIDFQGPRGNSVCQVPTFVDRPETSVRKSTYGDCFVVNRCGEWI